MSVPAPRALTCIKEFRHAVVQSLIAANISGIGANVSASREHKAWPEEKSFIVVTTPSSDYDDRGTRPRFYFAESDLYIDVYARSFLQDEQNLDNVDSSSDLNDFLDDTMNAIVSVIEPCPFWKGPYEGLVSKCVLKSYNTNLAERAETVRGMARIAFRVSYTVKVDRTAPSNDFLRAKNSMSADGGDSIEFTTNLRTGQ